MATLQEPPQPNSGIIGGKYTPLLIEAAELARANPGKSVRIDTPVPQVYAYWINKQYETKYQKYCPVPFRNKGAERWEATTRKEDAPGKLRYLYVRVFIETVGDEKESE